MLKQILKQLHIVYRAPGILLNIRCTKETYHLLQRLYLVLKGLYLGRLCFLIFVHNRLRV